MNIIKKNPLLAAALGIIIGVIATAAVFIALSQNSSEQPSEALTDDSQVVLTDTANMPKNMLYGALVVNENGVVLTEEATLPPVNSPEVEEPIVKVQIFVDYLCPFCKLFELASSEMLLEKVAEGKVQLEYHPVGFLSNYSVDAVNAMACIADSEPQQWLAANRLLFINQPDGNTASDFSFEESVAHIDNALKDLKLSAVTNSCIAGAKHLDWSLGVSQYYLESENVAGSNTDFKGTPLLIVNGELFEPQNDGIKELEEHIEKLYSSNQG